MAAQSSSLCQPAMICTLVIPETDIQSKFDQSIRTSPKHQGFQMEFACKLRAYSPLMCSMQTVTSVLTCMAVAN